LDVARIFLSVAVIVCSVASAHAQSMPLTLRQAIVEALAASPALRVPDDGRTLALIRERQSAARFGLKVTPSFQTGSDPFGLNQRTMGVAVAKRLPSGTTIRMDATSSQFGESAASWRDTGYAIGISQPLLRGWTAVGSADLRQAQRNTQSATRAYVDARQRLVVAVADAYFSIVRARRLVDAAERALDRASRLRTSSEARAKAGLATELDVLRADLLASQAEAALAGERETLETAIDALKILIGRGPDAAIDVADAEVGDLGAPADEPVERFVRDALDSRVDVREARDRIDDAKRAQTVARWNLLPPITFDAQYSRRGIGGGPAAAAFATLFNGWRFGVSTSYALDRSEETAAAAAAAVTVRAVERDAEDTERRVADEVRRAYRAWTRTLTTVAIQSKAVGLAERQVELAQIRYERGVAGNFDVTDAENNLFQAQAALIGAQVERALAGLTLRRVSGTIDPDAFNP
jgi:outer membrane protein